MNLKLYLIASKAQKSEDVFLNTIEQAIKGGVSIVQLREKNIKTKAFYELGLKVKKICEIYEIKFIINDRLDLALALNADGIHLGQDDLPINIARNILGQNKIIGLSVKNISQLKNAFNVDYLGCGAIFESFTKNSSIIGLDTLKDLSSNTHLPIVAIGGINTKNVKLLKDIKLAGIAISDAIMNADDPFKAALLLNKYFQ